MKLWWFIILCAVSSLAEARALSGEDLAGALAADLRYGTGQTNQQSYPIITMRFAGDSQDLEAAINKVYGNRFTITVDQSQLGPLFAVADISSSQCAGCAPALADPKVNIEGAFFYQAIPIGQGMSLVIGTPGIAHTAGTYPAGKYDGQRLKDLGQHFNLELQTRYRFHDSEVYTAQGVLRSSADDFLGRLGRKMKAAGYQALGEQPVFDRPMPLAGEAIDETLTWSHASGLVQVHVQRGAGRPQTKVNIYEVTSR